MRSCFEFFIGRFVDGEVKLITSGTICVVEIGVWWE
jgi:hypothetical protein